jgi:hypothetical protein
MEIAIQTLLFPLGSLILRALRASVVKKKKFTTETQKTLRIHTALPRVV